MYVKSNGVPLSKVGVTVPPPFSVIVTLVAEPPKVFPVTVYGVNPHVLPLVLLKVSVGGFVQLNI